MSFCFQGRSVDFPPSKLKAGYGEQACYVLDCLAEEALKHTSYNWKRYDSLRKQDSGADNTK